MRAFALAGVLGLGLLSAACDGDDGAIQSGSAVPAVPTPTPTGEAEATTATPTTGQDGDPSPTPVDDERVTITVEGDGASAEVRVELALTRDEIMTGLMHRESLEEDHGMLFVFEEPSHTGFWMRNTLIPLDIAYIAEDGRIREIRRGEPLNEEVLRPELPYSFVLEVNAGWFERNGLGVGDRVVLPVSFSKS